MMSLLSEVKVRLGIFYSDDTKDAEIQSMIDGAIDYFRAAGWDVGESQDARGREAIVLYCKMAQSTDPSQLTNHPVLISMIAQGRASQRAEI